jgi:FkbM family methyltransferase
MLEAGANNGSSTVDLALYWPKSEIHAFEPVPSLFDQLTNRTAHLPNVKRYRLALSDRCGQAKMFVSRGEADGLSSLLRPKGYLVDHPGVKFDETVVNTITMDEWASMNDVKKIDFMWLDMQGLELPALKSGEKTLKNVLAIFTEVSFREYYDGASKFPKFRAWLEAHGFRLRRIDSRSDEGDALFTK